MKKKHKIMINSNSLSSVCNVIELQYTIIRIECGELVISSRERLLEIINMITFFGRGCESEYKKKLKHIFAALEIDT